MFSEVIRILKPGGCYIVVSFASPEHRTHYFTSKGKYGWKLEHLTLEKPKIHADQEPQHHAGSHHVYILTKE